MKYKYHILLILFVIAFIFSIILSFIPVSDVCDLEKGCDLVQQSKYNAFLGIKNSYFGVIIFAFASILTIFQIKKPTRNKKNLIHTIIIISSIIAFYLIYVQHSILEAYCKYCMVIDISMIASLITILFNWKK